MLQEKEKALQQFREMKKSATPRDYAPDFVLPWRAANELTAYKKRIKNESDDTKSSWEAAETETLLYKEVYTQAEILLNWLQYDVLQLPAAPPAQRSMLFDFIIDELEQLAKKHPHRIKALITTLKNQKGSLLNVVEALNIQFAEIAKEHNVSIDTVWDICYLARFDINAPNYHIQAAELEQQLGELFDCIEDKVLNCIATTYRTSSVIENLNSRLRPFLDKRKGFKSKRYALIQFMLNHIPFQRTANPLHKGKCAAELFVKHEVFDWMTLLGLTKFKRAA